MNQLPVPRPGASDAVGATIRLRRKSRDMSQAAHGGIPLNDPDVAARIIKAIEFYQQHAPAAAPSPF
jgi:hypothetical protein